MESLISAPRPNWKSLPIERNKVEFQFRHTMVQVEKRQRQLNFQNIQREEGERRERDEKMEKDEGANEMELIS